MSKPAFRRLAAIMFTDIVGYTAMMQSNEPDTLLRIKRHRRVLEDCVARHSGDLIQYYGDGSLSILPSAIDAVRCALEIQQELLKEPHVPLRIGLHVGDVVREADAVFGDGVNVSARIQSLGVAGSVLLSRQVQDKMKNQPAFDVRSLGKFQLKNVSEPMEVFALVSEGLSVPDRSAMTGQLKVPDPDPEESIAVLPFENLSSDAEQEYFSDGMTEEILNALAQIPRLKVAGRTSAFSFKGRHVDLREVGRQLNVRAVLEGSVRKAGGRVRITAQLIDAVTGYHLWSERYDRELHDIFSVQDEISLAIADKLQVTLLGKQAQSLVSAPTDSVEAYQLYLRGRHYLDQRYAVIGEAIACFDKAVELDSNYAAAYAGLGLAYLYDTFFGFKSPAIQMPRARDAASEALRLDPNLPEGHQLAGVIALYHDWDWQRALYHDQRAIDLRPGHHEGYRVIAYVHSALLQPAKAIEMAEKAVTLDPLNANVQISLAELLYRAGRFADALAIAEALIDRNPQLGPAHDRRGLCHLMLGDPEAAIAALEQGIRVCGDSGWLAVNYSVALAKSGRRQEALDRLHAYMDQEGSHRTPMYAASVYATLEDSVRAIESVREAIATRDPYSVLLRVDPVFQHLRGLTEFKESIGQMGFPG